MLKRFLLDRVAAVAVEYAIMLALVGGAVAASAYYLDAAVSNAVMGIVNLLVSA